jgi:hypothetical protein
MAKKNAKRSARPNVEEMVRTVAEAAREIANKPPEQTAYQRIAERVMAATRELNKALEEAHRCEEMRVFMDVRGDGTNAPKQFLPSIYQMTHSVLLFTVKVEEQTDTVWQAVKPKSSALVAGGPLVERAS